MRGQEARDQAERKAAMATLAQSSGDDIVRLWNEAGLPSQAELLRGPETGLVTLRGRIGGGGAPFNVGEATVTRATVRLPSGQVGHCYALGRSEAVFAVQNHAVAAVEQNHRGAGAVIFALVDHEVRVGDLDGDFAAIAADGVEKSFAYVEI